MNLQNFINIVQPYSMTSQERIIALYNSLEYIRHNNISGDLVECGVWRGGNILGIMEYLLFYNMTDRIIWLYDTFQGMTNPSEFDTDHKGTPATNIMESVRCYASIDDVQNILHKSKYDKNKIKYIIGDINQTLLINSNIPNSIALLRLDTDWYESTKTELNILYPKLLDKGVLIIDDYGHWQGCKRATDEFFLNKNIIINYIDYTGIFVIKNQLNTDKPNLYESRMKGQSIHGGRNILLGLDSLCAMYDMNKNSNVLELGTNDGVSSKLFAYYANTVHAIDINKSLKLENTLSQYKNIIFYQKNIPDAINDMTNDYFDFIYIDADHKRQSVLGDIGISIPKLKNNGIICGHDYEHNKNCEVKQAVDSIFPKENIQLFNDTSWAVKLDKKKIFYDTPIYLLVFNTVDIEHNTTQILNNLSPYFDDIFYFNENTLKTLPNSDEICNTFEQPLSHNYNSNKVGYFDFKPFLIDHILKTKIPENSILLYHDGNFQKVSQYWHSQWSHIKELLQLLLYNNGTDFFIPFECSLSSVKNHVKINTINKIFASDIDRDIVKNSKLLAANKIVCKNTPFTRTFISQWLELCKNKDLICPPKSDENLDPEFLWNCGDQDLLNCLIYKYILNEELPIQFPMYYFPNRIFSFANIHRQYNIFLLQKFITNKQHPSLTFYQDII